MREGENISLREIEVSDLDVFYAQQLHPEAIWLAAFVSKDPKDRTAFNVHWKKILSSPQNINRTIIANGETAGHIAIFPYEGKLEVTYWLGRKFWGKGVATQALIEMLRVVVSRPIGGRVAKDNLGSLKVLQKCGFKIIGEDKGFANGRGAETEEYILRLE